MKQFYVHFSTECVVQVIWYVKYNVPYYISCIKYVYLS